MVLHDFLSLKPVQRLTILRLFVVGWGYLFPWLSADAQPYVVDPALSRVDVSVKATGDSFVAHLEKFEPSIVFEPQTLATQSAVVTWDFADLKTGKEKRDRAMLEWLEHSRLPRGTFTMTQWELRGDQTWAIGHVAFHGVTNVVSIPVAVTREGDLIRIRGEAELDYRHYQLKIIRMMFLFTVEPKVTVTFDLRGRLDSAQR